MIEQAIKDSSEKLMEFTHVASKYINLQLELVTVQMSDYAIPDKEKFLEKMQQYVDFYIKQKELEQKIGETMRVLNIKFNEAVYVLIVGMQNEDLLHVDAENVKTIQDLFMKFYSIASIEAFRKELFIDSQNRILLGEMADKLSAPRMMPQFRLISEQIRMILGLNEYVPGASYVGMEMEKEKAPVS